MRLRNIPGSREHIAGSSFCIQAPEQYKGRWADVFANSRPIRIEVGMGKGRFLMQLAEENPDINYIGIEMYSSVLIRAIEKAEAAEKDGTAPANFRFIRMDARDLPEVFAPAEIDRIYLNFSDPWPKDRHAKRRLTSVPFLERYARILKPEGLVEFKTDNIDLFRFSLEQAPLAGWQILQQTEDLHHDPEMNTGNVLTEYEEKFSAMGNPICKMILCRTV